MKEYDKLQETFRKNTDKLDTLGRSLQSVEITLQQWETQFQQLVSQEDTYAKQQEQYHQLQGMQQEVERYREILEKRTALEETVVEQVEAHKILQQEIGTSGADLEGKRHTLAELNRELQSYVSVSEEKLCASELRSWWDSLKGVVDTLQTAWDRLTLHRQQLSQERQICTTREGLFHHNEQLLRQHQAYEVSLQLEEQAPCPVCGSLVHPQLAQAPSEDIVRETVDCLRDEFQASQTQVATTETKLAHSEEEVERYRQEWNRLCETYPKVTVGVQRESILQLGTILDRVVEAKEIETVAERLSWWSAKIDEVAIDQTFRDIQKELDHAETKKLELVESLGTLQETIQIAEATVHEKQLALRTLEGQLESLQQEVQHVKAEMSRIETSIAPFTVESYTTEVKGLAESLKRYEADRKAVDEGRQTCQEQKTALAAELGTLKDQQDRMDRDIDSMCKEMEQVLQEESLTISTFKEQSTAFDTLPTWKETFTAYHNESLRLTALLEEVQQDLAAYSTAPETIPKESVDALQQELKELGEVIGTLKSQVAAKEKTIQEISKLEAATKELSDRRAFIFSLADLANGGDSGMKGISFERYVLGAILEEVLSAANLRLHDMSRGRYRLERSLEEGGRGARGLDIAVFDAYTGASRPANTLSGGETFLASLGLAMGLADVIQSYAGGIHLDTMFIDEGFGTLDSDTLDVAMETLVALQSQGRLVGIISHVPELQQQIGAHLVVTKTDGGSKAYFQVP